MDGSVVAGSWKYLVCLCMAWHCQNFPFIILPGITCGVENLLVKLELFYAGVIHSFAYVNSLNLDSDIQCNIWATKQYPKINGCMVALDYIKVADLPVIDGILNYHCVQMKAQHCGYSENLFLLCSTIQKIFGSQLGGVKSIKTFPLYLENTVKKLLKIQ